MKSLELLKCIFSSSALHVPALAIFIPRSTSLQTSFFLLNSFGSDPWSAAGSFVDLTCLFSDMIASVRDVAKMGLSPPVGEQAARHSLRKAKTCFAGRCLQRSVEGEGVEKRGSGTYQ